jgi:hypothetical protein
MIITSGITQSSSSTVGICRQNINLTPITYDGCAKVFSKPYVYNHGFLLSRGHPAAAAYQIDPDVADQLRSFGLVALCRLRRTRDRHVVSLGYRGCHSRRRRGRSTPIVQSVIGSGSTDIVGWMHHLVAPPAARYQRHFAGEIPMIIGNRRHASQLVETLCERTLIKIERTAGKRSFRVGTPNNRSDAKAAEVAVCRQSGHMEASHTPPSLYLLNAAALSKPQAVENPAVDLSNYNIDVAVITETNFKLKHSDTAVAVDGYTIFRRDRQGRRAGGIALYVRSNIQSSAWSLWTYSADNRTYELYWVRVGNTFVAALYHPPVPVYKQKRPTGLHRGMCSRAGL